MKTTTRSIFCNCFSRAQTTKQCLHRGGLADCILSAIAATLAVGEAVAADIRLNSLRCEYRQDPIGIDVVQPRLSWTLEAVPSAKNQTQSAYRVRVASTPEELASEQGDLWDSGKVASDQTIHLAYAGKPLQSRMHAWWKVRSWDKDGQASAWSAPATWTMGLLHSSDWGAKWIAHPDSATNVAARGPLNGYHSDPSRQGTHARQDDRAEARCVRV
jgi:alpha-L-rhamnosidase